MTNTIDSFSTNSLAPISFIGGSYRELAFDVYNSSGSPVNLTSFTSCQWTLSPFGQPDVVTLFKTGTKDAIVTNRFWIYLYSTDTVYLSGKYVQQPTVIAMTDYEFRLGQGYVNIVPSAGFTSMADGKSFTDQLIAISGSIVNYQNDTSASIVAFEAQVSGSITTFENQVSGSLATMIPASGSTLIAGTNNTQYASAKGLKDAGFIAVDLISGSAYKKLWISNWQSNTGVQRGQLSPGNGRVYDYLPFAPTTDTYAYANVEMPDDYTGGGIYIKFAWTHPATTTNFGVIFGLAGVSIGDGENLSSASGTAQEVTDTGGTTYYRYNSPISTLITLAGTPAAGELVQFVMYRKGSDSGTDTLAVDAYLLGTSIWYPVV